MPDKTRVLILGGGFGGVYTALTLDRALRRRTDLQVTLVSADNFMLFTPMLHEVASGELEPGDITNPVRQMVKRVRYVEADVTHIDLETRTVRCARGLRQDKLEFGYDHLVLAIGSTSNFFGIAGVERDAVTMKTLGDAARLRNRMLATLELASTEPDPDERRKLLTYVAAGGGFAGIETVGAVNDYVRDALRYYPDVKADELRVVVVHPHGVVLPELGEKLGRYTQKKLQERGVEVILDTHVTGYDDSVVTLSNGQTVPAHTLIWTAGVKPADVIEALPLDKEKGRIKVTPELNVVGHDNLWAVGDCASVPDHKTGKPQPPTAQHGLRQAVHAANNLLATLDGKPRKPFLFSIIGQLASIGRHTGVAQIFGINFSGLFAWFLWRCIYLEKLPRLSSKLRVMASWTLDMLFRRDYEQLFTTRDVLATAKLAERFASRDEGRTEPTGKAATTQ